MVNLEFIRVAFRVQAPIPQAIQISFGSCLECSYIRAAKHEARESFLPGKTCCILSDWFISKGAPRDSLTCSAVMRLLKQ